MERLRLWPPAITGLRSLAPGALLLHLALLHSGSAQTAAVAVPARQPNASVYSSLDEKVCRTHKTSSEGGYSEQVCPGVGGFRLKVVDADARMSVTVISPDGKQHPLHFDQTVTPHFSSLGPRAEWRVPRANSGGTPFAVTVRLTVNTEPSNPAVHTSYLVVSRVDAQQTCVVKVIENSFSALDEARSVSDRASTLPCVKGYSVSGAAR